MLIGIGLGAPSADPARRAEGVPGSFVPTFVPVTGTNTRRPSEVVALQRLPKGV